MKKLKISTGLHDMSDVELTEEAAFIISSLTGNTNYQNPIPTMPNMVTLKALYDGALVKAEQGSLSDTEFKNELREALANALTSLARYVEENCQDNKTILLSSGFRLRKTPERVILTSAPDNVMVKDGIHIGEAIVTCKKSLRVVGYVVRYTQDIIVGNWKSTELSTKTKISLTDLEVGKSVYVQVKSVNANGVSEWSNTVMLRMVS